MKPQKYQKIKTLTEANDKGKRKGANKTTELKEETQGS